MSLKTINDEHLIAIGNAIRSKNGTEETYKPSEMAAAIRSIEGGGSGGGSSEIVLKGNCQYALAAPAWAENLDNIKTQDITDATYMFYDNTSLIEPNITLNGAENSEIKSTYMFYDCENLKDLSNLKFNNYLAGATENMFRNCYNLRTLPTDLSGWIDWREGKQTANRSGMFRNCYSLRSIPNGFLHGYSTSVISTGSYSFYAGAFQYCYSLDEIVNIPVLTTGVSKMESNMFSNTFSNCSRVKDIIFEDCPDSVRWHNQVIDLSSYVGYFNGSNKAFEIADNYNSGIVGHVDSDIMYNLSKDSPNWFASDVYYSRYNHDSAVRTINSLPDAGVWVSSNGNPNTIKFKNGSGLNTDGGSVSSLTDAEIAVAAAKGWTVTFV